MLIDDLFPWIVLLMHVEPFIPPLPEDFVIQLDSTIFERTMLKKKETCDLDIRVPDVDEGAIISNTTKLLLVTHMQCGQLQTKARRK